MSSELMQRALDYIARFHRKEKDAGAFNGCLGCALIKDLEAAIQKGESERAQVEREIVEWLRAKAKGCGSGEAYVLRFAADEIERGEHRRGR